MIRTFEDLECWKKAAALRVKIASLTKSFPSEEKFKLTDQIIRSSRSVAANIAEGYGRFHYQEYTQYCRQARGSLYETLDHLIVAEEQKYISKQQLDEFRVELSQCIAVLNGFINYLQKAKNSNLISEPEESYGTPHTIND